MKEKKLYVHITIVDTISMVSDFESICNIRSFSKNNNKKKKFYHQGLTVPHAVLTFGERIDVVVCRLGLSLLIKA